MSDDTRTATPTTKDPSHETVGDRAPEHPPADEPIFTRAEIAGFEEDDATAGRAIGKMLAMFFVYTVIAMSIAAWWTWSSIAE